MEDLKNNSVYIHIPFCNSICTYCDFAKVYYNKELVSFYLDTLESEIKSKYSGELIKTIYIGGGTPSSLSNKELTKLFNIISIFKRYDDIEFTFECNIESIDRDKLQLLYDNGVNRLSIGVETFNDKYLKYLNRHHTKEEVKDKIEVARTIGFKNINVDLIYAIPTETIDELIEDIDILLSLNIEHISTYSLMIEPHTVLYINKEKSIDEELDREMYDTICSKLTENGYKHYEISNFSRDGYCSRHNLVYWNNMNYYGFGAGASGYINNTRYDNTRSITNYISGKYIMDSYELSNQEIMENEFMLGFRKIDGINKDKFRDKYEIDMKDIPVIRKLVSENKLVEDKDNIYINSEYIYTSNDILAQLIDMEI